MNELIMTGYVATEPEIMNLRENGAGIRKHLNMVWLQIFVFL